MRKNTWNKEINFQVVGWCKETGDFHTGSQVAKSKKDAERLFNRENPNYLAVHIFKVLKRTYRSLAPVNM